MLAFGTKTQRMRGGGGGGRLFEAGRLLTFSAFRMGAYSRWALIRGWELIRINTVLGIFNTIQLTLLLYLSLLALWLFSRSITI